METSTDIALSDCIQRVSILLMIKILIVKSWKCTLHGILSFISPNFFCCITGNWFACILTGIQALTAEEFPTAVQHPPKQWDNSTSGCPSPN